MIRAVKERSCLGLPIMVKAQGIESCFDLESENLSTVRLVGRLVLRSTVLTIDTTTTMSTMY